MSTTPERPSGESPTATLPDRLPGESPTGYQALLRWLEYPPPRPSLARFAAEIGRSQRLVHRWSADWSWRARADAMDRARLDAALTAREQDRERARQVLLDAAPRNIRLLMDIAEGTMPEGDQVPLLNRHGDVVGTRPAVPPGTRAQAAKACLEVAGLTAPKRVELAGKDGAEIRLRARQALSDLSGKQLAALAEAFGVDL